MPPSSATEFAPPPPDRDPRLRRLLWIVFLLVALTPPGFVCAYLAWDAFYGWPSTIPRLPGLAWGVPSVVALGIAGAAAGWGLRRRCHLRPGLLTASGLAAGAVVALVVGLIFWVKGRSEDGAVKGNVSLLAAAADMYFLERGGPSVGIDQLIGPDRYIKALYPVNREIYPAHFTHGHTITVTGVAGSRTITYAP